MAVIIIFGVFLAPCARATNIVAAGDSGTPGYLLNDTFLVPRAAKSVNGTLPEPGPGGNRVVDIDTGNHVSINEGKLLFDGIVTGLADPLFSYNMSINRVLGQTIFFRVLMPRDALCRFGLDTTTNKPSKAIFLPEPSGVFLFMQPSCWAWTDNPVMDSFQDYAIILRRQGCAFFHKAKGHFILLHISDYDYSSPLKPVIAPYHGKPTFDEIRCPERLYYPVPLVSSSLQGPLLDSTGVGPVTPALGAEMLTDPGLEATYTEGLCNTLVKVNSPVVAQSADAHGGSKAQQFTTNGGRLQWADLTPVMGAWYRASLWGKAITGAAGDVVRMRFVKPTGGGFDISNPITATSYAQYIGAARAVSTNGIALQCYAGTNTVVFDDGSVKPLVLSSLFATKDYGKNDIGIATDVTPLPNNPAGVVICLDSAAAPANFIIGYINLAYDSITVYLEKCVAGVYSSVMPPVTATYVPGATLKVEKSGTAVSIFYNGALAGSGAVTDAGIIKNTIHGRFSTLDGNILDNFRVIGMNVTDLNTQLSDGFGHAESTGLGSGGSGLAWTTQAGTIVTDGHVAKATALSDGRAIATVSLNTPDVVLSRIPFVKGTIGCGIVLRYQDAGNYVYVWYDGAKCNLVKRVAGAETTVLGTRAPGVNWPPKTHTIGVVASGTNWVHFFDNTNVRLDPSEGAYSVINELQSPTRVGIIFFDTNSTVNGFLGYARGSEGQYDQLKINQGQP